MAVSQHIQAGFDGSLDPIDLGAIAARHDNHISRLLTQHVAERVRGGTQIDLPRSGASLRALNSEPD